MSSETGASAKGKFASIEIGRGVASALVVLHHTSNILMEERFYGAAPFGGLLHNFNVGVDFFFVLSGFIIAWIHWGDLGHRDRLSGYAQKRFLRIYPPYWGVLLALIVLYLVVPSAGDAEKRDPLNILLSIALVPNTVQPLLGVAWTLTHEIFFYLLFGAILLMGRKALWILPAWAAAIIAWNLLTLRESGLPDFYQTQFPLSFLLSAFNLEFIMGVGAAAYLRQRRVPRAWMIAAAGALSFLALMVFAQTIQTNGLVARLAFGLSAMAFILGMVEVERNRRLPLPAPLALFGSSSYAVYLVHTVILISSAQIMRRLLGTTLPLELATFVLFLVSVSGGVIYHLVVEPLTIRLFSPSGRKRDAKRALGK